MKKNVRLVICMIMSLIFASCVATAKSSISLHGEWKFSLDEKDIGETENWPNKQLTEIVSLPGSLQEQGKGYDIGINTPWTGWGMDKSWYSDTKYEKYRQPSNIKVPFWLNPDKHYVGVAWYQKEIEIPAGWQEKPIEIELERTHWQTTLYIDGKKIGSKNSLQTPHRYLMHGMETGKHTLTFRVDNRMHIDIGSNAHIITDHTQTNWNGIIGNITISAKPKLYIDDLQIYPNIEEKNVTLKIRLNGTPDNSTLKLNVTMDGKPVGTPTTIKVKDGSEINEINAVVEIGESMKLWSEFRPNVYQLHAELLTSDGSDKKDINFGFRDFKTKGTLFEINGHPTFLRGTLECCIFPQTGYPAMDSEYWEKMYRKCREYGLNHIRFHSWCPPEVAFDVADKMGIYLQVECGAWTNVGDGNPQDNWIKEESDRILKEYGNHPSFCLMAYGNEPSGHNQVAYLSGLIAYWKSKDTRRVYTSAGGWPYVENADYFNTDIPRIGGNLDNAINTGLPSMDYDHSSKIRKDMPMLSHEIGQWCVYPNFNEMKKYTGVLKPKNFEIFQNSLIESGMADLADEFLYASGKLQVLCYKADIEAALRTDGQAGFQLLDLHDFPGQGTALVGVLDAFWDEKGYVTGKEFSQFCNQTVPLLRFHKLIWKNNETLKVPLEFAHYGEKPINGAQISWKIETLDKHLYKSGKWTADLPIGNRIPIGNIEVPLNNIKQPTQLKVTVEIDNTASRNSWNIWVYPSEQKSVNEPYITYDLNDAALEKLEKGENVLLLTKGKISPEKGSNIKVGFSTVFWNTAWTGNRPPHTLGIYCDANHPVFASFPNEGYSDYQWRDISMNCNAMILDAFPDDFRPIIHLIDDWFQNRKLGILFETKVGKGKLMVCSIDIENKLDTHVAIAQFRQSLFEYMASDNFSPSGEVQIGLIQDLIKH